MKLKYAFQLSIDDLHPTEWYLEHVGAEDIARRGRCVIEGVMLRGACRERVSEVIRVIATAVASIEQEGRPMVEMVALYRPELVERNAVEMGA